MSRHLTILSIIIVFLVGASSAYAEKSTELYIPMGQSPGLSGKYTVMGKIDAVNYQNQTLTMSDSSGSYTVKVTGSTQYYLDKSNAQLTNTYGTMADCKAGDTVEVKFEDNARGKPAEWIKIRKRQ